MQIDIEQASKMAFRNRKAIQDKTPCGCYYCSSVFNGAEIKEWADAGDTAICPKCNIDSVVPGMTDKETLDACYKRWFGRLSEKQTKLSPELTIFLQTLSDIYGRTIALEEVQTNKNLFNPEGLDEDQIEDLKEVADAFIMTPELMFAPELNLIEDDKCEICHGENGGVPGNENVIDGKIVCDYCHAKMM